MIVNFIKDNNIPMYENIPILMKEKQLKFAIVSINPNSVTKTENKVTNPS